MEDKTRERLVDGSIWLRGLHMLVLAVGYNVVEAMLFLSAIFQFFSALFTGRANEPLLQFSKNGSIYIQETLEFLTFNSEIRTFPFSSWPDELHTGEVWLDEAVAGASTGSSAGSSTDSSKSISSEMAESRSNADPEAAADDGHPEEDKPK